jgi:ABC-2 type transport system ATP-binding protein
VESGTLAAMRHLTRTTIEAEVASPPIGLAEVPGVHGVLIDGNRVRCEVDGDHLDDALRRLTALGVRSIVAHPPTLEELFLRHYRADEAPEPS